MMVKRIMIDRRGTGPPPPPPPAQGPPASQRRRIGIATRLFVGFGALTTLVFLLAVANLVILERVTRVGASVLESDVPLLDATDRWIEELLEEESYARRAALLGSEQLMSVAREEGREFVESVRAIEPVPAWLPRERLLELHEQYAALLEPAKEGEAARAGEREERLRATQAQLIGLVRDVARETRRSRERKMAQTAAMGSRALGLMAVACAAAVLLSAGATLILTRGIARPIRALRSATERIASGRFDVVPDVRPGDELGDLAGDFAEMARRLKHLEEMNLDASPLTRLPGNIAIENVLGKRLARGAPLVFCLVDIDNFKAYNDRYGYARGSELIKATGRIVEQAVRELGDPADFVGHIGGDDFVVITTPERYRELCGAIISRFGAEVGQHYDPEDVRRGSIEGKTRQGQRTRYPLTSVSIAVVTCPENAHESPIRIGEVAADLKEYAKGLGGGVYVVDRRRSEDVHGRGAIVRFPRSG